ncbi:MAG: hypothetical protein CSA34_04695 [Desulfobulbus propionicus]|nr:MAG: hypothetical protein CSA34_04695 [Desulfobulbus propionicus]
MKISNLFTSLTTAFVLFLLLAVIFGYGSHIAALAEVRPVFRKMTSTHIWAALGAIRQQQMLLYWLLALVAVAVALFANTLCCTWKQFRNYKKSSRVTRGNKNAQRMMFIHVAALLVIVFHGLDVAMVQRHLPQKIAVGDSGEFNGYTIKVEAVEYITDKKYIREDEQGRRRSSFKIPYGEFSIKENKARLGLYREGRLVQTADIKMFSPVRLGSTFFFLDGFYLPRDSEKIGITIHSSYNPLVLPFFLLYACLLSILLWHALGNRFSSQSQGQEGAA